jgi:hypothetical protein
VAQQRPSPQEVWRAVKEFAEQARRTRRRVPTLTHEVPNRIVAVNDSRIRRSSQKGLTDSSYVSKGAVIRAVKEISRPGGGSPTGLYFTRALLVHALRGRIRHADGRMWFEGDAQVEREKKQLRARARRALTGSGRAGGESPLHKSLKEFILRNPNVALSSLSGGPFVGHDLEYWFPTCDEVDVYLTDRQARPVLVEVKPDTSPRNLAPWGQAAKYRTLWAFFKGVPERSVRVVVAAPRIHRGIARQMLRHHRISSVQVRLPRRMRAARAQ